MKKYHGDGLAKVMDCCQSEGVIWRVLSEEFAISSYWGMDEKHKSGRLKIDSSRVLAQHGWQQNIIDIDTYGSPWKHWNSLYSTVEHSCTVFLTWGLVMQGGGSNLGKDTMQALGLGEIKVPPSFSRYLAKISLEYHLFNMVDRDILITEAVEAVSHGNARYIGLRLDPSKKG
jgi:hypothetical protein